MYNSFGMSKLINLTVYPNLVTLTSLWNLKLSVIGLVNFAFVVYFLYYALYHLDLANNGQAVAKQLVSDLCPADVNFLAIVVGWS